MSKVYVLLDDKGGVIVPKTVYEYDPAEFKRLNAEGWGVFLAVNDFEATPAEMKALAIKNGKKAVTKRNISFLKKINAVFADLDIAKKGDGQTREGKEAKKELLLMDLYEICPPSLVIDTSNGVQPKWNLIDSSVDADYQTRYVAVINAIIAWSKEHGAMGDDVKDVTRFLRMPGYYHMKEEPYMVEEKYTDRFVYKLEDLEVKFKDYLKKEPVKISNKKKFKLDDLSRAIDSLDIQEIFIRAMASIGRAASFDKTGRVIIEDRGKPATGNFKGRLNDDYIASSSHEDYSGNRITSVAKIKDISNKEARTWLIDEFGLRERVARRKLEKVAEIKERPLEKYYSWGTKDLTESIAPIKRVTYGIVGGAPGTGKTPFCINLALENVKLGHRVLYLSLEMTTDELFDFLARKHAHWTIPEEIYNQVPEYKQESYEARLKELRGMDGFVLKGIRGGGEVDWECLKGLMEGEWDLVIVDNFNLIQKSQGVHQLDHEKQLSKNFLAYTAEYQTPIIIVHHYSKGGARENQKSGYSLSGSTQIYNDAQRLLLLSRKRADDTDELTKEDKAELRVFVDKGRSYDSGFTKVIYFRKGVFFDTYQEDEPIEYWQDKI